MKLFILCFFVAFGSILPAYAMADYKNTAPQRLTTKAHRQLEYRWTVSGNLDLSFSPNGQPKFHCLLVDNDRVSSASGTLADGHYTLNYLSGIIWQDQEYAGGQRTLVKLHLDNGQPFCVSEYDEDRLVRNSYFDRTGQVLARMEVTENERFEAYAQLPPLRYLELLKRVLLEHLAHQRDITSVLLAIKDFAGQGQQNGVNQQDVLPLLLDAAQTYSLSYPALHLDRTVINPLLFSFIPADRYDQYLSFLKDLYQTTPAPQYLLPILSVMVPALSPDVDRYLKDLSAQKDQVQLYSFYVNFVEGNRVYRQKNYQVAIDRFQSALEQVDLYCPDQRDTLLLRLGEAQSRTGLFVASVDTFKKVFNTQTAPTGFSGPDLFSFYYWYAIALENTSDYWTAAETYSRLDRDPQALKALGLLYIDKLDSPRNAAEVISMARSVDKAVYNLLMDRYEMKYGQDRSQ